MSAVPVFFSPDFSSSEFSPDVSDHTSEVNARAARAPGTWQLTDRGTAVVMVIAAVIMTVALTVIAVTAVRVTNPDYDASLSRASQTHD